MTATNVEHYVDQLIWRATSYGASLEWAVGADDPTLVEEQRKVVAARRHLLNLVCHGIAPPADEDIIEAYFVVLEDAVVEEDNA